MLDKDKFSKIKVTWENIQRKDGKRMKYEAPEMEILILETHDVVTLSNGGSTDGDGNTTDAPDGF